MNQEMQMADPYRHADIIFVDMVAHGQRLAGKGKAKLIGKKAQAPTPFRRAGVSKRRQNMSLRGR